MAADMASLAAGEFIVTSTHRRPPLAVASTRLRTTGTSKPRRIPTMGSFANCCLLKSLPTPSTPDIDNDFPGLPAILEVPVSLRQILKGKNPVDHRLQLALTQQGKNLLQLIPAAHR